MSYQIYSKEDALKVVGVLEFDESHVDNDNTKKPPYEIGDTVEIIREDSKHFGIQGVVVYTAYGTYRVEPYNDSYWNNPLNVAKLGPFTANELKKIKKKSNWSTVYKGGNVQAGVSRINPEDLKVSSGGDDEIKRIRKAFSGGASLVTKV